MGRKKKEVTDPIISKAAELVIMGVYGRGRELRRRLDLNYGYIGGYDGPGTYEPDYSGDIIYYEKPPRSTGSILFVSLLIGVIVGGITLLIMRSGMKTAKRQNGAAHYLKNDVRITKAHHHYLYSRTTRTAKSEYKGGGSGGGSHVHSSSGGRSHGGGGGRF